jgi:prepilin-type N-terminal cleavage/methylation domain-containing protein
MKIRSIRGFNLIELLLTILISSVIIGISISLYSNIIENVNIDNGIREADRYTRDILKTVKTVENTGVVVTQAFLDKITNEVTKGATTIPNLGVISYSINTKTGTLTTKINNLKKKACIASVAYFQTIINTVTPKDPANCTNGSTVEITF